MALPPHCANTHMCTHMDADTEPHPQWVPNTSQTIQGCSQSSWNTTAEESISLFIYLILFIGITFIIKCLFAYVHKGKCMCVINSQATFFYCKTYGKRNGFISKWAACIIGYGSLINNALYKPQWIQPLECSSSGSQGVHNPQYFL